MPIALVGVRSRGVPIAERLAAKIAEPVPVGAVDITLYRDDLAEVAHWPVLHGTEIPFGVDGVDVRPGRRRPVHRPDGPRRDQRRVRPRPAGADPIGRAGSTGATARSRSAPTSWGCGSRPDWTENIKVRVRPLDPVDEVVRVARPVDFAAPSAPGDER